MDNRDDGTLLATSDQGGDAFTAFVERHHPAIHRYLARRVGHIDADDLAAETFYAAYRRRRAFDGSPNARPWLFGIATNLLRDHARREARMLAAYARTGIDPVAVEPKEPDVICAALAGVLAGLRLDYRNVLFLHAVAELSDDEIAIALRVPVGTVKTWLHRARSAAQHALAGTSLAPESTISARTNEVSP